MTYKSRGHIWFLLTIYFVSQKQAQSDEEKNSDDEVYGSSNDDESSDDDKGWVKDVKKQHKMIRRTKERVNEAESEKERVYEFSQPPKNTGNIRSMTRVSKSSLGDRLSREEYATVVTSTGGNREMKFTMRGKKSEHDTRKQMMKHHHERKQIARKTGFLAKKRFK